MEALKSVLASINNTAQKQSLSPHDIYSESRYAQGVVYGYLRSHSLNGQSAPPESLKIIVKIAEELDWLFEHYPDHPDIVKQRTEWSELFKLLGIGG